MSEIQINGEETNEFVMKVIDEEKFNSKTLQCKLCKGQILKPGLGKIVNKKMSLHTNVGQTETEELEWHFKVEDMWHFENIGFTHTVSDKEPFKYLICGVCNECIIGKQFSDEKHMYVSLHRVDYIE